MKVALKRWFKKQISKYFFAKVFTDSNASPKESVILASVHRSGSTFLMETTNYKNEYRVIFEPFHTGKVNEVKEFSSPFYIATNDQNSFIFDVVDKIVKGELRNKWSDAYNFKFFAKKRLIKCVRSNLMLKYIRQNFPNTPMILLLRNPFATINSWLRSDYDKDAQRKRILSQAALVEDFLSPFVVEYEKLTDAFEIFLFNWCINYYVPLKQFSKESIYVVYYENLLDQPEIEVTGLFKYLNRDFDMSILKLMKKPSSTTRKTDVSKMDREYFESWRKNFTKNQVVRGIEILKLFNLDGLYNVEGMPNTKGLDKLLRSN